MTDAKKPQARAYLGLNKKDRS